MRRSLWLVLALAHWAWPASVDAQFGPLEEQRYTYVTGESRITGRFVRDLVAIIDGPSADGFRTFSYEESPLPLEMMLKSEVAPPSPALEQMFAGEVLGFVRLDGSGKRGMFEDLRFSGSTLARVFHKGGEAVELITNEVLVRTRPEDEFTPSRVYERVGAVREGILGVGRVPGTASLFVVRLPDPGAEAIELSRALRDEPWVVLVEPNVILPVGGTPSGSTRSRAAGQATALSWYLEMIGARDARRLAPPTYEPLVAVFDEGFDVTHPDLSRRLESNTAEQSGEAGVDDDHNDFRDDTHGWNTRHRTPNTAFGSKPAHGQAVAGLVLADSAGIPELDGENPMVGVCPHCRLLPIVRSTNLAHAISGVGFAIERGADVLVGSWYHLDDTSRGQFELELRRAATEGRGGKGMIVFFAAGNDDRSGARWPASSEWTVAIGASDCRGEVWDYSHSSTSDAPIDLVAPSGDVDRNSSDCPMASTGIYGHGTAPFGGSSGAAPIAAGVAALILSVSPDLTRSDVLEIMKQTATAIAGDPDKQGEGQVKACKALERALWEAGDLTVPECP